MCCSCGRRLEAETGGSVELKEFQTQTSPGHIARSTSKQKPGSVRIYLSSRSLSWCKRHREFHPQHMHTNNKVFCQRFPEQVMPATGWSSRTSVAALLLMLLKKTGKAHCSLCSPQYCLTYTFPLGELRTWSVLLVGSTWVRILASRTQCHAP